jgi:hypothetical protein
VADSNFPSDLSNVQCSSNDRRTCRAFKHHLADGIGENCRRNHLQICDAVTLPTYALDENTNIASQYLFFFHVAALSSLVAMQQVSIVIWLCGFAPTTLIVFGNGFGFVVIFLQMLTLFTSLALRARA